MTVQVASPRRSRPGHTALLRRYSGKHLQRGSPASRSVSPATAPHLHEAYTIHPPHEAYTIHPPPGYVLRAASSRCLSTPASPSALANASISPRVCAAEMATRSRAVPGGTVGGRMAGTRKPDV
jgi:hypothetical protein